MSEPATATAPGGLTDAEVAQRVADGRVNITPEPPGRSVGNIIRANLMTPINAIMIVLFALILISGNWRDGLFVGVVVSNTIIGVVTEVRARAELAKLQVITAPQAVVVRNGESRTIGTDDIVIDDLVELSTGDQAAVDGEIMESTGLQMDESMLTGESEPVAKVSGDDVLSGSFVVAGFALIQATQVGADSYASALATEAKTFSAAESKLRQGINLILKWLTYIIPVASILLLISLLDAEDQWQDALQGAVAAAVAMVPDGLVLLTSLAFVAGVLELSKRKALAKQLSTVEVLARVDVLCLDKTGTITTGEITLGDVTPVDGRSVDEARVILAAMAAADRSPNATMAAISDGVGDAPDWVVTDTEPFSSSRKWSAASFADHGWFYIGAPDFLLPDGDAARERVGELSTAGKRVLVLVAAESGPDGDKAPTGSSAVAVVELDDEIRPDAPEILAYFAEQNVTIKVISGDNHDTVAAIASRAGLADVQTPIDARSLPDDIDALADQLEAATVFGRVVPHQKQAMVKALQSRGHVVAMTGDGVNDVLALKDADLGIAMGSGSPASRSVADLVLTDSKFASLPTVVAEGRKVINNVERVANLFVTKAAYAVLLTVLIGIVSSPFPLLPRQLTLIGTFSIGIPGFFLALAPEVDLVRAGFLHRVLRFSVPAGIAAGTATFVAYEISRARGDIDLDESRTLATITLLGIGLVILATASRPLRPWKIALVAAMAAGYCVIMAIPFFREFFELDLFTGPDWWIAAIAVLSAGAVIATLPLYDRKLDEGVTALAARFRRHD